MAADAAGLKRATRSSVTAESPALRLSFFAKWEGDMPEFAGTLRERVTIEQRLGNRDALGAAVGAYAYGGQVWAAVSPLIPADLAAADSLSAMPRWQVTMRKREGIDLRTRLVWRGRFLGVRGVVSDPRDPARMVLTCEEKR
jgi:head-tail adaptor